jgi:hypothetical protein
MWVRVPPGVQRKGDNMSVPSRILNDLFSQKLACDEKTTEGNYKVSIRLASGRWAILAKNLSEEMATSLTAQLNALSESGMGVNHPMADMETMGIRDRLSEVHFARKIVPPKMPTSPKG